ncbi:MAG: type II toxin-antitoxin system RelE/ParE family toxin [Elusimicrobiota bacterium]|nr:type II toxin-antitoxin system RelE/ParE family toxin [Elusimicrobiota bacterium]
MLKLFLTHRAEKDVKHLSVELQEKIKNALRILVENPLKGDAMIGKFKGLRRYRVGDFRIVYEFDTKEKYITIIKIGHRRGIYR